MSYLMYADKIQRDIIKNIFANDDLCKLLYYDTTEALEKPNLTYRQKNLMLIGNETIQDKEADVTKKIYTKRFDPEFFNDVKSQLRISKEFQNYNNLLVKVYFFFEIIVHTDIENIGLQNRSEMILDKLIGCLNGINCIGKLEVADKIITPIHFGKKFSGVTCYATVKMMRK